MAEEQSVDKSQLKQYLVPAVGLAAVVVLVGLVLSFSGVDDRKMSDGSNGSADDPGLKEISPGVKYRDIKEGKGDVCLPGAGVTINYTGWLTNGDVFDTTKKEGLKAVPAPATFELNGLIAGWREGIPGMKAGGIRKLVISPDKGYGSTASGKIPASSTLIFEVELISSTRPRRSPPPSDLTKLVDGTAPGADDPQLKPLGTGGLKYRDIKEGDGAVCPEGAHVVMDYTGWLLNGSKFDSSWTGGKPLDMSLGSLIKGWQEGVPGMKVGGIRKLVIPADLAYGSENKPGIPANSTLVFEIELLGFK